MPPGRAYLGPDGYGQAYGIVPPAIRPWGRDDTIGLAATSWRSILSGTGGPGRHRHRLKVDPPAVAPWWQPTRAVRRIEFAFDATAAEAAAVRTRVEAWRDAS